MKLYEAYFWVDKFQDESLGDKKLKTLLEFLIADEINEKKVWK